jgi:hypothetical protein
VIASAPWPQRSWRSTSRSDCAIERPPRQVHPLPGLWPSFRLDTAITLPVGVEAYAAYALDAWLTANTHLTARTRGFARRSATGSLLLGMAGQIAYHPLTQAHATRAPCPITTAVSCQPVRILGMSAALAQLIHTDTHHPGPPGDAGPPGPDRLTDHADRADPDSIRATIRPGRLADARATAARLHAAGQPVSRRTLRSAGLRGSNAELGALAHLTAQTDPPNQPLQREPRPVPSGHQSKPRAIPITHSDQ